LIIDEWLNPLPDWKTGLTLPENLKMMSLDTLRERAHLALHKEPSQHIFDPRRPNNTARSDFDLDKDPGFLNGIPLDIPVRQAAVLFPIILHPRPTVLLTQRSHDLPSHAGQISFPGGKVEPHDANPLATALRETEEEIGLARDYIEPLGYLDNYRTGTNFNVVPVVALVRPGFELVIDRREVDSAFEVPLDFLLDEANHELHERDVKGRSRTFYAMPYGNYFIWGATAGMIRNFHERLHAL
jgi:8-oxo-dGTP pyrophosphatase MutT (NUDIX family)